MQLRNMAKTPRAATDASAVHFATVDALFRAHDHARVRAHVDDLLREGAKHAAALKAAVGDHYADLLGSADEASRMSQGTQDLIASTHAAMAQCAHAFAEVLQHPTTRPSSPTSSDAAAALPAPADAASVLAAFAAGVHTFRSDTPSHNPWALHTSASSVAAAAVAARAAISAASPHFTLLSALSAAAVQVARSNVASLLASDNSLPSDAAGISDAVDGRTAGVKSCLCILSLLQHTAAVDEVIPHEPDATTLQHDLMLPAALAMRARLLRSKSCAAQDAVAHLKCVAVILTITQRLCHGSTLEAFTSAATAAVAAALSEPGGWMDDSAAPEALESILDLRCTVDAMDSNAYTRTFHAPFTAAVSSRARVKLQAAVTALVDDVNATLDRLQALHAPQRDGIAAACERWLDDAQGVESVAGVYDAVAHCFVRELNSALATYDSIARPHAVDEAVTADVVRTVVQRLCEAGQNAQHDEHTGLQPWLVRNVVWAAVAAAVASASAPQHVKRCMPPALALTVCEAVADVLRDCSARVGGHVGAVAGEFMRETVTNSRAGRWMRVSVETGETVDDAAGQPLALSVPVTPSNALSVALHAYSDIMSVAAPIAGATHSAVAIVASVLSIGCHTEVTSALRHAYETSFQAHGSGHGHSGVPHATRTCETCVHGALDVAVWSRLLEGETLHSCDARVADRPDVCTLAHMMGITPTTSTRGSRHDAVPVYNADGLNGHVLLQRACTPLDAVEVALLQPFIDRFSREYVRSHALALTPIALHAPPPAALPGLSIEYVPMEHASADHAGGDTAAWDGVWDAMNWRLCEATHNHNPVCAWPRDALSNVPLPVAVSLADVDVSAAPVLACLPSRAPLPMLPIPVRTAAERHAAAVSGGGVTGTLRTFPRG